MKELNKSDVIAMNARRRATLKSLSLKRRLRIKQLKEEFSLKVREVNIRYARNGERLAAKYAAGDYAKSERAKRRAQKAVEREERLIEKEYKARTYTLAEEITSAIIQGAGSLFFVVATVLLALKAKSTFHFGASIFFGAAMMVTFLFSCLHHALVGVVPKTVFSVLSKSFIALVVLGGASVVYFAYRGVYLTSLVFLCIAAPFYIAGLVLCILRKIKFLHVVGDIFLLTGSVMVFLSFFYL